jgi:hypothetical protein
MTNAIIDFISRDCRNTIHQNCCGLWRGLGFEILCYCKCHKKKEQQQALAEVVGPETNATVSLTQEATQDDD